MDKPQSSLPCRDIVYRWGRTRSWAEIKVKHTDHCLVRYSDMSTSLVSFHLLSTNSVAFYTIASCTMLRYDVIYYFCAVWSVIAKNEFNASLEQGLDSVINILLQMLGRHYQIR